MTTSSASSTPASISFRAEIDHRSNDNKKKKNKKRHTFLKKKVVLSWSTMQMQLAKKPTGIAGPFYSFKFRIQLNELKGKIE